ncbi:hypothetical protein H8356DRAFT_1356026 [Neocallimastix lanati (nom. inval.)]|nr:hypothetical protein H8356DRAFT_1356026 [Neocallimastix sp. JGI-2020a]
MSEMCCAEIDTRTLPRIDGSSRDAEIRKFRINNWFRWEDDIKKETEINRTITQLKRLIIETKETVYNFNTKYLDLSDQLETEDKASISEEYDSLEDACRNRKNTKVYYRNLN